MSWRTNGVRPQAGAMKSMRIKQGFFVLGFGAFAVCAASRNAAACINPTATAGMRNTSTLFDKGGSNLGATLKAGAGMYTAADLRMMFAAMPWMPVDVPAD